MRLPSALSLAVTGMLALPGLASADFAHVVVPGESLDSIAAADGLGVDQLAAANGLSADAPLQAGETVMIPPQDSGGGAAVASGGASASPGGSYVVQPGDTLSSIAANAGTTVDALASANGLDPSGILVSGTVLSLSGGGSGGSSSDAASSQPVGAAASGPSSAPPYPTNERVSAGEIGSIAASEGVPPALAEAIAWQESGFNNAIVSSAGATGVMQITPGTWSWIGQNLATPPPPDPSSAAGNIRAGTLLLHSLLQATGGNEALAAAGYYQGLPSVQQTGEYSDTQQYVGDVMSLERQFGGG